MSALPVDPSSVVTAPLVATSLPAVAQAPAPASSTPSFEFTLLSEALKQGQPPQVADRLLGLLELKLGAVQARVAVQKENRESRVAAATFGLSRQKERREANDARDRQRLEEQKHELEQLKARQAHQRGLAQLVAYPLLFIITLVALKVVFG